jgi:hypothetical protein
MKRHVGEAEIHRVTRKQGTQRKQFANSDLEMAGMLLHFFASETARDMADRLAEAAEGSLPQHNPTLDPTTAELPMQSIPAPILGNDQNSFPHALCRLETST